MKPKRKPPPNRDLPPDWFCAGQEDLLDLLKPPQCEHCFEARNTCDACVAEGEVP